MSKPSSVTRKILNEFSKNNTIKLDELYFTLSQNEEFEHIQHLKHRIRSSLYNLKKQGRIELVSKSTYQILD